MGAISRTARDRLGYNGETFGNGIRGIKWSSDQRWHMTSCGRANAASMAEVVVSSCALQVLCGMTIVIVNYKLTVLSMLRVRFSFYCSYYRYSLHFMYCVRLL